MLKNVTASLQSIKAAIAAHKQKVYLSKDRTYNKLDTSGYIIRGIEGESFTESVVRERIQQHAEAYGLNLDFLID
ncbi:MULTISPECIES: hypothetical protein [unclassified Paenibacillus]|uniref:hypothetical protein n=1 Tax=unclassified Paenibacillus TaxID=185978 RepID=UPI00362E804C